MRALLPFLACLMLVFTSLASIAHAAEAPGKPVSSTELSICHAPGDANEVPSDGDSGAPHHHSICHGHDLSAPAAAVRAAYAGEGLRVTLPAMTVSLTSRIEDTPHRPPIT